MIDTAKFLKGARKRLNVTQAELAEMVGATRERIANYENHRSRLPGNIVLKIQEIENNSRNFVFENDSEEKDFDKTDSNGKGLLGWIKKRMPFARLSK